MNSGRVGKVDDAAIDEGAAIVDLDHRGAAVFEILHVHPGRQRQVFVRRGHRVHVIDFAAGGFAPVELDPVPGGDAALDETLGIVEYVISLAENDIGRGIARFRLFRRLAAADLQLAAVADGDAEAAGGERESSDQ